MQEAELSSIQEVLLQKKWFIGMKTDMESIEKNKICNVVDFHMVKRPLLVATCKNPRSPILDACI